MEQPRFAAQYMNVLHFYPDSVRIRFLLKAGDQGWPGPLIRKRLRARSHRASHMIRHRGFVCMKLRTLLLGVLFLAAGAAAAVAQQSPASETPASPPSQSASGAEGSPTQVQPASAAETPAPPSRESAPPTRPAPLSPPSPPSQPAPQSPPGTLSSIEEAFARRTEDEVRQELRLFGYDVLRPGAAGLHDVRLIAPGPDYVVGPGDELIVMIFGQIHQEHRLPVGRDGFVTLPNAGPVSVAGLRFAEVQDLIRAEVQRYLTGVQVHVTAGELRTQNVYVVGHVSRPGAVEISSLGTVLHALLEAGGPVRSGSLRNIRIVRNGEVVSRVDLYDFLLEGNQMTDIRLRPDDVIVVPPIGKVAGIAGEVRRPGLYELKDGEWLSDLVEMAGGLQAGAFVREIRLDRYLGGERRVLEMVSLDLSAPRSASGDRMLMDGDLAYVPRMETMHLPGRRGFVTVEGNVQRSGNFALAEGMRVSDLIEGAGGLLGDTHMDRAEVLRFVSDRSRRLLTFSVEKALAGDPGHDLLLEEWDVVRIYHALDVFPEPSVEILGAVNEPGRKLFFEGMTVRALLFHGKEPREDAYLQRAYLFRERTDDLREVFVLDLAAILDGDEEADLALQPNDHVRIFTVEEALPERYVYVSGAVRTPGALEAWQGMRVSDLLFMAGGLADPEALHRAELHRRVAGKAEREVFEIDLQPYWESAGIHWGMALEPGDHLHVWVERHAQDWGSVTLSGEVRYPGRYPIAPGESLASVIGRAGGLTDIAYPYGLALIRPSLRDHQNRLITDWVNAELERISRHRAATVETALSPEERELRLEALRAREEIVELVRQRASQGRVVLPVETAGDLLEGPSGRVRLQDGDQILIPAQTDVITVAGAVFNPESALFIEGWEPMDYIMIAGGPVPGARVEDAYVLKANGRVETAFTGFSPLKPGDVVVVPFAVGEGGALP